MFRRSRRDLGEVSVPVLFDIGSYSSQIRPEAVKECKLDTQSVKLRRKLMDGSVAC